MNIRLAIESDVPAIMQIVKDVVPAMRAAGNNQWDDNYPNPEVFLSDISLGQLWIAEDDDGRVAGVSAITTEQYPEYAQAGLDITEESIVTHRLVVSPHYRGKGIAALLMQQAEDVAKSRGINLLRVDTNSANQATQSLFPKVGYQFMGEMDLQFRPGMKFYCYEKRLKHA